MKKYFLYIAFLAWITGLTFEAKAQAGCPDDMKLQSPVNATAIALDKDNATETVTFSWDDVGATYSLIISKNANLSDPVIVMDNLTETSKTFTHADLQAYIDAANSPLKKYLDNTLYWNVKVSGIAYDGTRSFTLAGMKRFIDVRGEETNTYDVSIITLTDGSKAVWLARNLNAAKWLDGSDIGDVPVWNNDLQINEDYPCIQDYAATLTNYPAALKATAGKYYLASSGVLSNLGRFVPDGWELPHFSDYQNLFDAAIAGTNINGTLEEHGLNRLKIPSSDGVTSSLESWNMNMNGYGRQQFLGPPFEHCTWGDQAARIITMMIHAELATNWYPACQIHWRIQGWYDAYWDQTMCTFVDVYAWMPVRLIYTGDNEVVNEE